MDPNQQNQPTANDGDSPQEPIKPAEAQDSLNSSLESPEQQSDTQLAPEPPVPAENDQPALDNNQLATEPEVVESVESQQDPANVVENSNPSTQPSTQGGVQSIESAQQTNTATEDESVPNAEVSSEVSPTETIASSNSATSSSPETSTPDASTNIELATATAESATAPDAITTPATQPVVGSMEETTAAALAQKPKSKKKKLFLFGIPALILVTIVGVFLALQVFGSSNIKLTQYDSEQFSVLYPEGYEKEENKEGGVSFKEPIDADDENSEDSQSQVIVYIFELPDNVSDEQRKEIQNQLGKFSELIVSAANASPDTEVKNNNTSETTFLDQTAEKFVAEVYEKEQKSGDIHLVSTLKDDAFIVVGVLGHVSDPGLINSSQKIIDSFVLK